MAGNRQQFTHAEVLEQYPGGPAGAVPQYHIAAVATAGSGRKKPWPRSGARHAGWIVEEVRAHIRSRPMNLDAKILHLTRGPGGPCSGATGG